MIEGIAISDGIAASGSTQDTATALTAQFNRITTATYLQGVKLPEGEAGLDMYILNQTGTSIIVYGEGDTIDGIAGETGVLMTNNMTVLFTCFARGKWYTEGLASSLAEVKELEVRKINLPQAPVGNSVDIVNDLPVGGCVTIKPGARATFECYAVAQDDGVAVGLWHRKETAQFGPSGITQDLFGQADEVAPLETHKPGRRFDL